MGRARGKPGRPRSNGAFYQHYMVILESERAMNPSFEQTLVEVCRQTLVENAKVVD